MEYYKDDIYKVDKEDLLENIVFVTYYEQEGRSHTITSGMPVPTDGNNVYIYTGPEKDAGYWTYQPRPGEALTDAPSLRAHYDDGDTYTYYFWNDTNKTFDEAKIKKDEINVIRENSDTIKSGWNIVLEDVTYDSRITLPGDVHLIIAPYKTLTVNGGINVPENYTFSIYATSNFPERGTLIAKASDTTELGNAGIGSDGSKSLSTSGTINIHGCHIIATGGLGTGTNAGSGAGIGGGFKGGYKAINIYSGVVEATGGGKENNGGAGIGMGSNGAGGPVNIYYATIRAYGAGGTRAIDGGSSTITINGNPSIYRIADGQKGEQISADNITKTRSHNEKSVWIEPQSIPTYGSVISQGCFWTILVIALIVIVGAPLLIFRKSKKSPELADNTDDKEDNL